MKRNRLGMLFYRFLVIVALSGLLIGLSAAASSPQASCCKTCLQRFEQCDGTTIVCCQLYDACVQHCQSDCGPCPDAR